MDPAACSSSASSSRGTGCELWLQRPGNKEDLERTLALFATTSFSLVTSAPRVPDPDESDWAEELAAVCSAPHEVVPELAPARAGEPDAAVAARAWPALERALGAGHARILAVVSHDVLRVCVARALGIAFERSSALRVDPGCVVCLRDDPIGIVLRRSNVLLPEESSAGTALPGGKSGKAGATG